MLGQLSPHRPAWNRRIRLNILTRCFIYWLRLPEAFACAPRHAICARYLRFHILFYWRLNSRTAWLLAALAVAHLAPNHKVVPFFHGCQPPHQKPGCRPHRNRRVTAYLNLVFTSPLFHVVELLRLQISQLHGYSYQPAVHTTDCCN